MDIYLSYVAPADYLLRLCACIILVLIGGLLAGLTIGYMSLDEMNLAVLATSGSPRQRQYAKRIQPLRRNGHWLLVTLLLGNTVVNETLPIVMHSILGGGGLASIVISTSLIFIFGEIIPQALCTRFGLAIGAFFAYPVTVLQLVLSPLGYPIALLLDRILGTAHSLVYKKPQLKELVSLSNAENGGTLTTDEVTIIRGALDLSDKMVENVMTDLANVYMVDIGSLLDRQLLTEMLRKGYSRVPVFSSDRSNIVGVLLVKSLILLDPDDRTPLTEAKIIPIPRVSVNTSLFDILNIFQNGGSHMAVVTGLLSSPFLPSTCRTGHRKRFSDPGGTLECVCTEPTCSPSQTNEQQPLLQQDLASVDKANSSYGASAHTKQDVSCAGYAPIGIITLEDVIEELIQEEIIDETDVFVDMRKRNKVVRAASATSKCNEPADVRSSSAMAGEPARHALDGTQDLLEQRAPLGQQIRAKDGDDKKPRTGPLAPTATPPPETGTDTDICSIVIDSGSTSAKSPSITLIEPSK